MIHTFELTASRFLECRVISRGKGAQGWRQTHAVSRGTDPKKTYEVPFLVVGASFTFLAQRGRALPSLNRREW